jgi:hypothetical protein
MEEETVRSLRKMRALAVVAILAAVIALVLSYTMYKKVATPLKRIQTEQLAALESKVDFLVSSRLNGRMDVELQLAILNLKELMEHTTGEIAAQAQKAMTEVQTLLDALRKAQAPAAPQKAQ